MGLVTKLVFTLGSREVSTLVAVWIWGGMGGQEWTERMLGKYCSNVSEKCWCRLGDGSGCGEKWGFKMHLGECPYLIGIDEELNVRDGEK